MIRNTKQSINKIAFCTGFSQQGGFNRAFKKSRNKTPLTHRGLMQSRPFGVKCQKVVVKCQKLLLNPSQLCVIQSINTI